MLLLFLCKVTPNCTTSELCAASDGISRSDEEDAVVERWNKAVSCCITDMCQPVSVVNWIDLHVKYLSCFLFALSWVGAILRAITYTYLKPVCIVSCCRDLLGSSDVISKGQFQPSQLVQWLYFYFTALFLFISIKLLIELMACLFYLYWTLDGI